MAHEKIVDIRSRQERWTTAYTHDGLEMAVSNHGRISIIVGDKSVKLSLVNAVDMLGRVSESMEKLSGL